MDDDVEIRIREELKVAERRLKAANFLFEKGMMEDAINRAYYSFLYAAKAVLNVLGFDAKTHSGLISEFGLRVIKAKLLDIKYGEYFRKAFELRESSDYEIGVVFGEAEVKTLIKNAEEFLETAKDFVKKRI